jgi:beta-aspartyl-peptidase (threonine type)
MLTRLRPIGWTCLLLGVLMVARSFAAEPPHWALAIHGGAGGLPKNLSAAQLDAIRAALQSALDAGSKTLAAGGSSLDAVQGAVRVMENSGVLNAGRGAVLDHEGFAELDAALMDGATRRVGSVAALRHVANPIDLARQVMEHSSAVLLTGLGAEEFAKEQGVGLEPDSYFVTERRRKELERAIEAEKHPTTRVPTPWHTLGTVGAVALDVHGNLAAATSTGGLTNKHYGRVGDSPIIGAGTYAENGVCAISATGAGEYFIRYTAASNVCARVKYQHVPIAVAARAVLDEMKAAGGEGGLIGIDRSGTVTMPYSSASMLRGQADASGRHEIVVESARP